MSDNWFIFDNVLLEGKYPRPGSTVHYHRINEPCNDRCYGVVTNERARTIEGTIIGGKL